MTRLLIAALLTCLLAACGGGDPDAVDPVEKPAPGADACTPEVLAKFGSCPPKQS